MTSSLAERSPVEETWRRIGAWFLGGVFLVAAASKLIDVYAFERSIDVLLASTMSGADLPLAFIRETTVVTVIAAETIVGLSLLAFWGSPRLPALAAAALLAAFSAALLTMVLMENPPACGCLGSWASVHADARTNAAIGLGRNAGLLLLALWLATHSLATPAGRREEFRSSRLGFTLIEVLVVIAVIAVVIAIALPALSGARKEGKRAESLSAVRQCYVAVAQYVDAGAGYLPYLGVPGKPELGTLPDHVWELGAPSYFRGQSRWWPTALSGHGVDLSALPLNERHEAGDGRVATYVWLTHAAAARPEYWVGIDPPPSNRLFAGVRLDEALYPAAKGLLLDVGPLEQISNRWNVGMADGSASSRSTLDPPSTVEGLPRPYGAVDWRVLTTPEGIRGRDY